MNNEAKELQEQKIALAMAELDRQFGSGSVLRMDGEISPNPAISTGALTLDTALGINGLPRGRVIEIFGSESSGKSTLALSVIAEAQKLGETCLYIDAEQALDPLYAHNIGVDMGKLLIAQPDYGEKAFEILEKMIGTDEIAVVVVDSVAALTPQAELEADMESQQMGLQARMMAKGLRKISSKVNTSNTLIIFINQIRQKIGVIFGNPETTPGGLSLKYYASVRLDLRKAEDLKSPKGEILGIKVRVKVVKNKMAAPYRITEFDILFNKGINTLGCIVDTAVSKGVLVQKGAWISYNGESFAHGRNNAIEKLANDLVLAEEIKAKALAS